MPRQDVNASAKKGKKEAEEGREESLSSKTRTSKATKSPEDSSQPTIDQHLQPMDEMRLQNLQASVDKLSTNLSLLASKEYIQTLFKQMITEDILSAKLNELESKIKDQVTSEIEKIQQTVNSIQKEVRASKKTIDSVRNQVSDLETQLDKVKSENDKISKRNKNMEDLLRERELTIQNQSQKLNDLEQYTRRNNIRIYGLEDKNKNESAFQTAEQVVKLVNNKLGIKITEADIDIAHRMGKFTPDGNRPVICRFISRFHKIEVIRNRRQLKNTSIVIKEDLTLQNAKLLEKTSKHDRVEVAWTNEGRVVAILKDSQRKIFVDYKTDLSSL